LILALDVYIALNDAVPGPKRPEIVALSALLRAADIHPAAAKQTNFRSPASVVMKLMNFRSIDPNYDGKGLTAVSRGDREVWDDMGMDHQRLSKTAATIRDLLTSGKSLTVSAPEPWLIEAEEGALLTSQHLARERDSRLVRAKKDAAAQLYGRLACEVCGFCFASRYGEAGAGYIECHHRLPLSDLSASSKTKLADLALICANCHRMLHARRPWLTVEQLSAILRECDDRAMTAPRKESC
jgi:5-methylcytosine-specific restriction protein A